MHRDFVLHVFNDSKGWIINAVDDVPDDRMAEQFPHIPNHPAWTLTHLCGSLDFMLGAIGGAPQSPSDWGTLAGPGTTPSADRGVYAPKAELLATFDRVHAEVDRFVRGVDLDVFERESPEHIRKFAPRLGNVVIFMLASHEPYHLAQLADWRRGAGLAK